MFQLEDPLFYWLEAPYLSPTKYAVVACKGRERIIYDSKTHFGFSVVQLFVFYKKGSIRLSIPHRLHPLVHGVMREGGGESGHLVRYLTE